MNCDFFDYLPAPFLFLSLFMLSTCTFFHSCLHFRASALISFSSALRPSPALLLSLTPSYRMRHCYELWFTWGMSGAISEKIAKAPRVHRVSPFWYWPWHSKKREGLEEACFSGSSLLVYWRSSPTRLWISFKLIALANAPLMVDTRVPVTGETLWIWITGTAGAHCQLDIL